MLMSSLLKKHIEEIVGELSVEEFNYILSHFTLVKRKKHQFIVQAEELVDHDYWVIQGCLRAYFVDSNGKEYIIQFAMENWWISDRESLLSGQPSRFNIDAIEDSEVVVFEKADMDHLTETIPAFNQMVNSILNKSFVVSQTRIHESISTHAEEKYENFVKRYPEFALRVPQGMIASYLGITPETLSRLRRLKR
jgi:CRP-like cAMP-binding protein